MVIKTCAISAVQNTDEQINLLAAGSDVYGRAKRVMAIQFTLTVPFALISSVLMAIQPDWKLWLTFCSLTTTLVDTLFLNRLQTRLKKKGATIQQQFDCTLFDLPWRPLRCSTRVESEEILEASKRVLNKEGVRKRLVDWYPPVVDKLPLPLARLICQRASFWWDLRQRDRVRGTMTLILTLLVVAIFVIALLGKNTVEEMILTVYVPLAPAVVWFVREILAQRDSVQADETGLKFVESIWEKALAQTARESEITADSILVQDALFDARSRSPLVFNWVYNLLRPAQQEQMEHKANELVEAALKRLSASQS